MISLSLFTPDLDLFDLNRVETLRGPQGTLFGSGSVGGTLRYITNQPRWAGPRAWSRPTSTMFTMASFGGHLKGAINVPLGDTAAVRAVGYYTKYAGFIDAIGPAGGNDVNDGTRYGGRISMLWQPIEELKITPARSSTRRSRPTASTARRCYNLYHNEFTSIGRRWPRQARAISAAAREVQGRDAARRPDRVL